MLGLLLLVAAFCLSLRLSWRKNIIAALIVVVLEGCVRKWILPGQELSVYFLKDAFIVTGLTRAYASLGGNILRRIPPALKIIMVVATVYIVLDAFNPKGSPFVGVFGVKAYLLYALIAPLGPFLFRGKSELCNMFRTMVWLSVPVCLLAVAQFYAPTTSMLNMYASIDGQMMDIATFGSAGNARVTGTFPYLSGMGCFVNFSTLCCLCLYTLNAKRGDRVSCFVALPLLLVAGYMTGARSVVFFQTFTVIVYLLVSGLRVIERIALIVLICCGAYYSGPGVAARTAYASRMDDLETQGAGDLLEDLSRPAIAVWDVVFAVGPIGFGTGSAHQARPSIEARTRIEGQEIPIAPEWEFPRNMIELGPIGFLLWIAVRGGWTVLPLIKAFEVRDATRRRMLILFFCFLAVQYTIPIVYNHVFSLYFWVISGCVLAIATESPTNEMGPRRMAVGRRAGKAAALS